METNVLPHYDMSDNPTNSIRLSYVKECKLDYIAIGLREEAGCR